MYPSFGITCSNVRTAQTELGLQFLQKHRAEILQLLRTHPVHQCQCLEIIRLHDTHIEQGGVGEDDIGRDLALLSQITPQHLEAGEEFGIGIIE